MIFSEFFFALRLIKKRLGFSLLCIFVIALGFSISIPLYTISKNFVFPSLPGSNDSRLVIIEQVDARNNRGMTTNSFDAFQLNFIRENTTSFEQLSGLTELSAVFSDGEALETFYGSRLQVTALSLMETMPILGRSLTAEDEAPNAEPVIVIGYDLWMRYYAGSPEIIGRIIQMNGEPRTVVGVMPEGFRHPQAADFWLPLSIAESAQPGTGPEIGLFGVLKEGSNRAVATVQARDLVELLSQQYPDEYPDRTARVISYSQGWINSLASFQMVGVLAASLFVLVFLNVANLLLITANRRIRELAIRTSVGANRKLLVVHVLSESFIICTMGALLGTLASGWVLSGLQFFFNNVFIGGGIIYWFDFSFNSEIFLLTLLMLATLWLLAGLFAAWRTTRSDVISVLGSESTGKGAIKGGRTASVLVFSQVILSFFLLLISGSYLYGFLQGYRPDILPDQDQYLSAYYDSSNQTFASNELAISFRNDLANELESIPQIDSLAFTSVVPGNRGRRVRMSLSDADLMEQQRQPVFGETGISANYFDMLSLPVIEGRDFDNSDTSTSEPVALVDSAFVSLMNLDESPVGKLLYLEGNEGEGIRAVRIVGLVPTLRSGSTFSNVYRPISQLPSNLTYLVAKMSDPSVDTGNLERQIRVAASSVDRTIPLGGFQTLSNYIQAANSFITLHVGMFGAPVLGALLLSIVGIYGLIARSIYERTSEIGVRRALGSTSESIFRMFIGKAANYLTAGAIVGGGGALLALNYIDSSGALDSSWPVLGSVFWIITLVLGTIVAAASYFPVKEAIAIEPGDALHYE